jgi:hypothetical protein
MLAPTSGDEYRRRKCASNVPLRLQSRQFFNAIAMEEGSGRDSSQA